MKPEIYVIEECFGFLHENAFTHLWGSSTDRQTAELVASDLQNGYKKYLEALDEYHKSDVEDLDEFLESKGILEYDGWTYDYYRVKVRKVKPV